MLLMIDNFDSFTFNLVHYFEALDVEVKVVRNNEVSISDIEALNPEYLVISPGPCDPNKSGISLKAIEHFKGKLPILGVCLGHQAIAQSFGANIIRADEIIHGKTSPIHHSNQGLFKDLPNPFNATRYHSLVIDPATLSDEFKVTAWIERENKSPMIMGIEHKTLPLHGVQFHPESVLTECGHQLLQNFLNRSL